MKRPFLSALLFILFGTFALAQTEVVFLDPRSPMGVFERCAQRG